MFKYKQLFMGIILGLILSVMITPTFANVTEYIFTQSNCKLIVDGQEYNNPDIPIALFLKDNSNFAPVAVIRDICNKLSIPFVYDNATKEIRITTNTTVNVIGKEETKLMSEVTSINSANINKITYRKDENNLLIATQNGVDYVSINDVEAYILSKHNDNYNAYFFKYDDITNTSYIEHNYREKVTKDTPININIERKTIKLLENIPSFKVKTNGIKIKYDYYLNSILPLFSKESSD